MHLILKMILWSSHYYYLYFIYYQTQAQRGKVTCPVVHSSSSEPKLKLRFVCKYTSGHLQWLGGKDSTCDARDMGLIPGWERSPGGGHGNPLQYSCLENPMDGGAWWATVHGVTKLDTTESAHACPRPSGLCIRSIFMCPCILRFHFFFVKTASYPLLFCNLLSHDLTMEMFSCRRTLHPLGRQRCCLHRCHRAFNVSPASRQSVSTLPH